VILIKFATEIKGQSSVDGHIGWINIDSMQWGVGRSVASQSGGSAKREVSSPSVSEVTFSRATDMASPELFFQACGGVSLGKCEIHLLQVVENKPQVYIKIELEEALISSYQTSCGGERPTDSFSVNFTKVSYEYDTFDGKKVVTGTPKKWDLAANKTF
jgi:type VI secretion system secreted protein Hcp